MPDSIRGEYHEELEALEASALGGLDLVSSALARTLEAIEHQDVELAQLVVADDDRIDGRYLEVHQALITLLATQSPVATDLRLIASLLHVLKNIERMGDQCVNICKVIPISGNEPPADEAMVELILRMGRQTRSLISQAKHAFEQRDVELARDLVRQDDVVDDLNRECFRMALAIGDDADKREWAMTMLLAARAIERIADNAVDIGEQVAFVVTGLFREFEDASHPRACEVRSIWEHPGHRLMLCAAIDIGSNTTRVLVAEPGDGQLKKVMEQRAYTRINKAIDGDGVISAAKIDEVCEVVTTQVRLARELGAATIRAVATAAVREASNGEEAAAAIGEAAGVPVEILSEQEEGRLAFIGATKALGHPAEGRIGVVDVGGGSTEVIIGTVGGGVEEVRSWPVGSGVLADELIASDPPSASEIRKVRDRIDDIFADVKFTHPEQAVAVGGSATSLRKLVGTVLEYETLERGVRVLCGDPSVEVARRFELDPVRVRILTTGVLLLEKVSELLGQPLQIGKGGLREGVILDLLHAGSNGRSPARLAA